MLHNLIKQCNSGWKMTPITAKLVSNKPCFYHVIFFDTKTKVLRKNEKSIKLSVLSVLIPRSTLNLLATGDIGTSWSAYYALTRLCWDGPVYSVAIFPAIVWSQFKLDLKESDNKQNKAHEGANGCREFAFKRVSCYKLACWLVCSSYLLQL